MHPLLPIMASLVATAKLNGVEPLAWLTDVLERMVSGRTKAHELERLLPWAWKVQQLEAAVHAGVLWSDDACHCSASRWRTAVEQSSSGPGSNWR